ncbi:MAG: glycine cleavage system aminomethyltransferase GcvT [Hyphomicrobiaceae bacterium]
MATEPTSSTLKRTPLYDQHIAAGAKMVPFAGYEMPVQYPLGVLKEHLWTREKAGLFDVSHMGQAVIVAEDGRFETAARALEALVPADMLALVPSQQRYTQLLAADGGILDDLMVTRPSAPGSEGRLALVVNAACKDADYAHLRAHLPAGVRLEELADRALLALQGPAAASVLENRAPGAVDLAFMTGSILLLAGVECHVSRSGYTGEDGYEISIPEAHAAKVWSLLASDPLVEPIGLGARDSLRLEAGLCLYGHDIDTTTSPIEAGLAWSIQKRRREAGGFPGAARVQRELKDGPARRRVGIRPEGRAPAREGTEILAGNGLRIGTVTSGGFGPTVNGPVAMGYVAAEHAKTGTRVQLVVRGKSLPAEVVPMPFAPHRYHRKPA